MYASLLSKIDPLLDLNIANICFFSTPKVFCLQNVSKNLIPTESRPNDEPGAMKNHIN